MKTTSITSPPPSAEAAQLVQPAVKSNKALHLARILVPTDFSSDSKKAVEYALAFARLFGASITLLHVVELKACPADFGYGPVTVQISSNEKLKKARSKLNAWGRKWIGDKLLDETVALSGSPYFQIIEAAKALETDLIIMGTHGEDGQLRTTMGSTAERVVRHAHCPVFVVRRKEHEFVL
ncbi:MAG: uspa protein [Pedosphaera sp.]|nr:uspa protein [Pedosphaera sp.]